MFRRPRLLITQSYFKVLFNINLIKLQHEWIVPEGYDTGIKVSSKKAGKKVPLILQNKHLVKWYICGPTVYDDSHVGHASCYIRFDILNRILKQFFDIQPVIALGITDIDDKIIIQAYKRNVDFKDLAKQYELEFFNSLNKLNVLPPAFVLRVSEHIPEIIEFISKIIDKGDAYAVEDGSVYFNTPERDSETVTTKVSLQPGQKHHTHFALWKGAKPGEPFWDSPWGKGRPGWHIECSAMASKVFGSQLDLHGGGIDLMFPHHANEEVQSCSYHSCKQWVNYWLYSGQLETFREKMSKSLNNFVSISDFLKSYSSDALRMYCFMSSYNRALHYGSDSMTFPIETCNIISKFLSDSNSYVRGNWFFGNVSESALLQDLNEANEKIIEHLKDDFDTGQCQMVLMELIRKTVRALNEPPEASSSRSPAAVHSVSQYVSNFYNALGFQLKGAEASGMSYDGQKFEFIINQVVNFRTQVRAEALKSQDKSIKGNLLKTCDTFRKELSSAGVVIKDQGNDKSSWSLLETQENVSAKSAA